MIDLTQREQDLLADLMVPLRHYVYLVVSDKVTQQDDLNCCLELCRWMDRFEPRPQELDKLYDKFHRTGLNS